MGFKTDTIAAISTAMTNSGIGIVRLSGEDAFSIIDKIYKGKSPKLLSEQKSHTIHYGYIMDGEQTIDEVLVLLMRGPHSYTGEDTVEIDCHGGVFVTRKILETVIKYGARPAEPGEFSKRAFLNGRMDLSQAEAVIDIISSKNDYALQSSVNQLKGSVHNKIKEIREVILYHTAFIESALDDPEHISVDGYGDSLLGIVKDLQQKIQCLLDTADDGRIIKEGIKTVIVGKPNAGKSSLINRIAGEDRAIVADIAGTTRDTVEEKVLVGGVLLRLTDTAGIRDSGDRIEAIGVERSRQAAQRASLALLVLDGSQELTEEDEQAIAAAENVPNLLVLVNKSDLPRRLDVGRLADRFDNVLSISAQTGAGLDTLADAVAALYPVGETPAGELLTNARQADAVSRALSAVTEARSALRIGITPDVVLTDCEAALEALGELNGKRIREDLVDTIFSRFCVGK